MNTPELIVRIRLEEHAVAYVVAESAELEERLLDDLRGRRSLGREIGSAVASAIEAMARRRDRFHGGRRAA